MKELYVYYRIGQAEARTALPQIERMFDGLRQRHAGLRARLLRRSPSGAGEQTWMEVYTHPGGITPDLQAAIEAVATGMPGARLGTRHAEVFESLASPGTC
jgi:hypothetical protein